MIPFLFVLMTPHQPSDGRPQWITELLTSVPNASRPASTTPSFAAVDPAWTSVNSPTVDANKLAAEIRASMERGDEAAAAVRAKAASLIERQEYNQAYLEVDRFVTANPHTWTIMWPSQTTAALLAGRFQDAERLCVKRMQSDVSWDPILTPYGLSLALASQGRVLPGQAAYVGNGLAGALSQPAGWEPTGVEHPKVVARNSALMLGLNCLHQTAFLELALRLDPKCAIAARHLVDEYSAENRADDAIRVAQSMVENLPRGEGRDEFQARLKRLQGQAPTARTSGEGPDRIERK